MMVRGVSVLLINAIRLAVCFCLLVLVAACDGNLSPEEEGGVIGTGVVLRGTASDNRTFARNEIEIKAITGEKSTASIDKNGRYLTQNTPGNAPYLIRIDLGNNEYRYGISHANKTANINSFTDIILRNWYVQNGYDINMQFSIDTALSDAPSVTEYTQSASDVIDIVRLVLNAYQISQEQILHGSFDANDLGVDAFLKKNILLADDSNVSFVITDPKTRTQSTSPKGFSLSDSLGVADLEAPETPASVRAIASSNSEMIIVWEPAGDNIGVMGYQVFRDKVHIATTPFPVYIDSGLQAGTSYSYEVIALDAEGNSSVVSISSFANTLTVPDTTPPPMPSALTLTPWVDRMNLLWGQTDIGDVVGFNIYRGSNEDNISFLSRVTSSLMADVTVSSGTRYCYRIQAIDASENLSELSPVRCESTLGETVTTEFDYSGEEGVLPGSTNALLNIPPIDTENCTTELAIRNVTSDTTIEAGCYIANDDIYVEDSATLTIAAGTTIRFAAGRKVLVRESGAMTAVGTSTQPIVLSGFDSTPGYWQGVEFDESNSSRNKFSYVVLEYAGGGQNEAALLVGSSSSAVARISLENSVIRHSSNYGFVAKNENVIIDSFIGNTVTLNRVPMVMRLNFIERIGEGNSFTGNLDDLVDTGQYVNSGDLTLRDVGVPLLSSGIVIDAEHSLSVLPGVELIFRNNSPFKVYGLISVQGTVESPVEFRGEYQVPGSWRGLFIENSGVTQLSNLIISDAGAYTTETSKIGNLMIREGTVDLHNIELNNGAHYGFALLRNSVNIIRVKNIKISNTTRVAYLHSNQLTELTQILTVENVQQNTIDVFTNGSVDTSLIISNLGPDYNVLNGIYITSNILKINKGVTLKFDAGAGIRVGSFGSLVVSGSESQKVRLTGNNASSGYWQGVMLENSQSNQNSLDHVIIENAGTSLAAIQLDCSLGESIKLSISNSTILNSVGWAVYLDDPECSVELGDNVVFTGNQLGDIGP